MPRVVPLAGGHDRASFTCGEPDLDAYFRDQAGQDVRRRLASCFVLLEDDRLAGFYTLSSAGIPMTDLPEALTKRLPRYPSLPAFRLGRLAVDVRFHGQGFGGLLLADALGRCLRAEAAGHLVLVEAKHERAAAFYRHYGFQDLESRPLTLFLPLATARKIIGPSGDWPLRPCCRNPPRHATLAFPIKEGPGQRPALLLPATKGFPIAAKVVGNTVGLKASQVKALERLGTRRFPSVGGYTLDQARELAAVSFGIGRQVGLLIDRKGRPAMVLVGTQKGILIPELDRSRLGAGRLRGVRLLHTHLDGEGLSQEDLTDMLFLRLDSVAALTVSNLAAPDKLFLAHLLPPGAGQAPYDVLPGRAFDRVEEDFNALATALEDELAREGERLTAPGKAAPDERERAVLVSVASAPRAAQESSLAELTALADTAGLAVAETVVQRVAAVNPKYLLGKGKLADIEVVALQAGASLLVFDGELSPSQIRNLAEVTQLRVIDRTQLILDIFAQHAASRSGKLQVEMAQLKYLQPRLVRQDRAMSRLMGGIGGRGPGETKLEVDRRRIRERIGRIKDELRELRKRRAAARAGRARAGLPVVSLVGYTNAGKSTLLNALTGSTVLAENRLFATLDPTSRRLRFPSDREIILTDTVGFIRELPKELKEAFRATLEELEAAELLLTVADASHPEVEGQVAAVEDILREMELGDIPRLLVLNKWDAVPTDERPGLRNVFPDAIPVSARTREGLDILARAVCERVHPGPGVVDACPAEPLGEAEEEEDASGGRGA